MSAISTLASVVHFDVMMIASESKMVFRSMTKGHCWSREVYCGSTTKTTKRMVSSCGSGSTHNEMTSCLRPPDCIVQQWGSGLSVIYMCDDDVDEDFNS